MAGWLLLQSGGREVSAGCVADGEACRTWLRAPLLHEIRITTTDLMHTHALAWLTAELAQARTRGIAGPATSLVRVCFAFLFLHLSGTAAGSMLSLPDYSLAAYTSLGLLC
jgi:hypothetical protein